MRRRRARRGAFLVAAMLLSLLLGSAAAARGAGVDEEGEKIRTDSIWVTDLGGDSVWVDSLSGDSIRQVVIEDSLSKIPSVTIDNVPGGFHPIYKLQANRIRQTTNMTNDFQLNYLIRDDVVSKTKVTWEKKKDDRLGRETDKRVTRTDVQHLLRPGLKVGLKFNREETRDDEPMLLERIARNKLLLQSTYIKDFWSSFRLTLNAEGGLDNRDKDRETQPTTEGASSSTTEEDKRGTSASVVTGCTYSPAPSLNVDVQGTMQRTSSSIRTTTISDGSREAGEEQASRDALERVAAKVRWDGFDRAKMNLSMSTEQSKRQFVRLAGGIETTTDRRRNATFAANGVVSDRTTYDAKLSYAWTERRYRIDQGLSIERLDYGGEISVSNKLPLAVRSRLTMKRSFVEDLHYPDPGTPDNTSDTDRGSVFLNLNRDLWAHTKLRATGSVGMVSRVYVDTTQDKDNLDRRLSMNLDYEGEGKIKGSALMSVDEVQSVNLHQSRSATNETRQSWKVSPTIVYMPTSNLKLRSVYTMTLIYIYKEFDSSQNTMTRVSDLRSTATWNLTRNAKLELDYQYKQNESGDFRKEGSTRRFAREREGSNQKLNLRLTYTFFHGLSIESGQFIQVDKKFDLKDGKQLESEQKKTQIYNQLTWSKKFRKNVSLRMKAKQIQDATVPVFSESGVLRPESRKAEWEVNGALTIEL